ncbi:EAL domain-containing protein [Bradyrhizobium sp.]|uniref:sensor domain-containing phosphodiesterase n=1 Tax=Bradyrhizobium sp. TaxID=376 RepID=UPI000A91BC79|nr:EAL domain-containing protein [Bradyrhizobium sp.]
MAEQGSDSLIDLVAFTQAMAREPNGALKRTLEAVRQHLGMQVAYVSEFSRDRTVFREVDAPGLEAVIKVGDSRSLDDVYCRHILEGRLPELIPDTSLEPLAKAMPITAAASIGCHISVPIRLPDGQPYGMFCCIGFAANPSLNARDLQTMRAFADLAAFEINRELMIAEAARQKRERIDSVIEFGQFSIVYQPIWNMRSRQAVGFECLTRFSGLPNRPPNEWFGEAAEVGLGTVLELATMRAALGALGSLPAHLHLAMNASVETITTRDFADIMNELPAGQIVVEITEHTDVDDYKDVLEALRPLRQRGIRLAVDDAGAGYSSLRHILNLQPDFIKLDMDLIRHIDIDPARRALASALIAFARDTDSVIIAEGVETASELAALQLLGAEQVQGYFLGRPMPLEGALRSIDPAGEASRVA